METGCRLKSIKDLKNQENDESMQLTLFEMDGDEDD